MNRPFVSVIIPCYNRKEWLGEAIAALRAQTYPSDRFEIIVVDNGSTDGAWEWLQEASRQEGVVLKSFRNDTPNRTPSGSRNLGMRHARGEIFAFTDSDCTAAPDWLERAVPLFGDGIGIVVGRTVAPAGDPVGPFTRIKVVEGEEYFDTANIFYTREAVEKTGGFTNSFSTRFKFPPYGEDSEFGLRVKQAGFQSVYSEDVIVKHRVRQQTFWQWLWEPRVLFSVPCLIKVQPAVRRDYLFLRYFLTPITALFDLCLLGAVLALWLSPWYGLLCIPFFVGKLFDGGKHLSPPMRLARVAGGSLRAFVVFFVLLGGSLRYGRLVI